MKIITWNINSIRIRIPLLQKLVHLYNPDIIALQETKVEDKLFPVTECINLGYKYITYSGQKSYNGVAILSRISFESTFVINLYNDEKRHIAINIGELSIHNFYVPAGEDIPDANVNIKFKHKLCYVDFMNAWFLNNKSKKDKIILLGDLNIAPLESDVWSSYQLRNVVSHTDIERKKLMHNITSFDWIDAVRFFSGKHEKLYSWWSYRNVDWSKSDRGRRLDHIWISHPLESKIKSCIIIKDARGWDMPSDHVPVMLEIET